MDTSTLLRNASIATVAYQSLGWAISSALKTEKFYDFFGTTNYLALAAAPFALYPRPQRPLGALPLACGLVCAWAVRLGGHLVARVAVKGHDGRFDKIKTSWSTFAVYWFGQTVWVHAMLLPVALALRQGGWAAARPRSPLQTGLLAAAGVFLLLEAEADREKLAHSLDPAKRGQFIRSGLWAVVRHPNYASEIAFWTSLTGALLPLLWPNRALAAAACAPPALLFLLLRYISGINLLEERALAKWGDDPEFQAHLKNTKRLVPFVY